MFAFLSCFAVLRRRPSSCLSPARRLRRSMLCSWLTGTPSKEVDSVKESSKPERPSVLAKRSTHAASLKHSKAASSVDAEITSIDAANYDRMMLLGGRAPEYLAHDTLVALASICLGQLILAAAGVAKDHKFTTFPPVKPAPVASGAHWVEPDTSNSGGW
ncbi:hypothetical protein Ahy_A07g035073 [Arachis hypogaea]|uniref:DJ-1/PfpI domain-containing protein n=1 Tax=Arachis hypogaea TaxID=3818 RepID=A0A445CDB2_ARAHY|nr:hypothetical protein Ahy_A07g035073 [Arachis hypogaea]